MSVKSLEEFTIRELKRQLHSARHAFHAVVKARYLENMAPDIMLNPMQKIKAREMYRRAMENYDGIIENAVSGATYDANQREMDKGFE